jgi:hypothetical protein
LTFSIFTIFIYNIYDVYRILHARMALSVLEADVGEDRRREKCGIVVMRCSVENGVLFILKSSPSPNANGKY